MVRSAILLLLLVCCASHAGRAQEAVLFRSHDAYAEGAGERVGTYRDIRKKGASYQLRFQAAEGTRDLPCTEIWGFTVNEVLFRIHPEDGVPVRLMAHGAVCYYENGFAHLRMQRTGSELEPSGPGHRSYIGRTLDGAIVPAVFTAGDEGPSGRFRRENPQFEPLFECIGDQDDLNTTRQCVVDFEALLEGDGHLRAATGHN